MKKSKKRAWFRSQLECFGRSIIILKSAVSPFKGFDILSFCQVLTKNMGGEKLEGRRRPRVAILGN